MYRIPSDLMKFQYVILLILAVIGAVTVSGCLGNSGNVTNSTNATVAPAETFVPEEPAQPTEETQEPSPEASPSPSGSHYPIIVSNSSDHQELFYPIGFGRTFGPSPGTDNTIAMYQGETIRFRNSDAKLSSKMLFHSVEGSFDDFILNPSYDCYMTFPELGKYQINLYNGQVYLETGEYEDFPVGSSMLTIYIVEKTDGQ